MNLVKGQSLFSTFEKECNHTESGSASSTPLGTASCTLSGTLDAPVACDFASSSPFPRSTFRNAGMVENCLGAIDWALTMFRIDRELRIILDV
jgi:hypothetical protein